jgi:hypothetical protein
MHRKWPDDFRHQGCQLRYASAECFRNLREVRTLSASANDLDDRPVGWCAAAFPAPPPHNAHPLKRRLGGELLGEASFADARFTAQQK